jgi:hypothetical protein
MRQRWRSRRAGWRRSVGAGGSELDGVVDAEAVDVLGDAGAGAQVSDAVVAVVGEDDLDATVVLDDAATGAVEVVARHGGGGGEVEDAIASPASTSATSVITWTCHGATTGQS